MKLWLWLGKMEFKDLFSKLDICIMKNLLLLAFIIVSNLFLSAQEITFYKDVYFSKKTSEKSAKYKIIKTLVGDTTIVNYCNALNNEVLETKKFIESEPVGKWTKNKTLTYNFDKLVYYDKTIHDSLTQSFKIDSTKNYSEPSFKLTEDDFFSYLAKEIKYPSESKDAGSSGTVYISFILDENGYAKPIYILKGVDKFIDYQTWMLIENMPKWKTPAKLDSINVPIIFNLPIRYTLR